MINETESSTKEEEDNEEDGKNYCEGGMTWKCDGAHNELQTYAKRIVGGNGKIYEHG